MRIDSYEFGRIVVDGKAYNRDLIIFPHKIRDEWWRKRGHELCLDDIKEIFEEKPETLIVGTGASGLVKILGEVKEKLEEEGIELIEEQTKKACEIYNKLSPQKRVVAVFHLTC